MTSANDIQFGGNHYKRGGNYQHWDWVAFAQLNYYEACATKYVSRHRNKNGMEDLNKAGHFVQKLLELVDAGHVRAIYERRGNTFTATVRNFSEANELTCDETAFCELLANYVMKNDLMRALDILDVIKANFRGQEEA